MMDNVDDIYPLSPMQRLMLMHSIRVSGSSTLSNQFRYRVHGRLDTDRFDDAWHRAIDRHPALRTAFVWEGIDEPVQVVRSRVRMPIEHIELDDHAPAAQAQELARIEQADRERGFDLTRAPLMRLTVVRLTHDSHVILWSRHHLILDLWSVDILFAEILSHYDGNTIPAADAVGFRDYIEWLGHQDTASAIAYYRTALADLNAPSLLFRDRARRSEWSTAGQPVSERTVKAEVVDTLAGFARSHGLTLGTAIQGAVALLIAERLRCDDVIYGMTVAGRPRDLDNVESILGTFINDVPVRAVIERSRHLVEWLKDLQSAQAARQPFEYLSPIDVQRCSGLSPELPLFDLLLLLESPGAKALPDRSSLALEAMRGPFDSALPMTLAVEHEGAEVRLTAVYDDAAVSCDAAESILADLDAWLRRVSCSADKTLGELLPESVAMRPKPRAAMTDTRPQKQVGAANILLDIWRRTLGVDDIGLDDDVFALGATSVQAAIAFTEIERQFGRDLPLSTLFDAGSVRALLTALDEPPEPAPSLVTIQRLGDRPPVLACSGIGGNVIGLSGIARSLGDAQPFFGLQPAGLSDGQVPASSIEEIASNYVSVSESARSGPIVLLGICFGANVILEMARQLAERGESPALLIVMDPVYDTGQQASPSGPDPTMLGFLRDRRRLYAETYRLLDPAERRQWLRSKMGALWNKIRHLDLMRGNRFEIRQRKLEAANIAAAQNYEPGRYAGETRVLITADRVVDLAEDPRQKWAKTVAPDAEIATVPGHDTGDALGQHAAVVADRLRRWIDTIE